MTEIWRRGATVAGRAMPLGRGLRPVWLGLALACALAGRAPAVRGEEQLLYGFERSDHGWRVGGEERVLTAEHGDRKLAGEPASISRNVGARQGRCALQLDVDFPGDIWAYCRPEADWSGFRELRVDVFVPVGAPKWLQVLFVIRDRDLWWYQAMPVVWLKPGRWQTLRLDISGGSVEWKARGHMKAWDGYAAQRVRLFGIRFFSRAAFRGRLLVDNLRGVRAEPDGDHRYFQNFSTNAKCVGRYEKFEITFCLAKPYSNPFDPDVVEVAGRFTAPSGRTLAVPGFIYQGYQRQRRKAADRLVPTGGVKWKIRFAPTELGRYDYWVEVRDDKVTRTRIRSVEVVASDNPGFVRVSRKDWHYFEFTGGKFFYPIGHNMHAPYDRMYSGFRHTSLSPTGGLENYERVLANMAANGENFIEIWMCPWWLALEWNPEHNFFHGLGRYNLQNAWKLDYLLDLAKQHGIYVHLVVQNHGMLSLWSDSEWADNPYNQAIGGFLRSPEQFFTNQRAIECFQKKMRYITARWGYATNLFGIELMSELDLTGEGWSFVRSPAKVSWHEKVTNYVKQTDPYQHLLTTHYSSGYYREDPRVVGLPHIDYTVTDGYRADQAANKDIVQVVNDTWRFNAQFKKPTFITEFGGRNAVESSRVLTMDLHCGLWASCMSPTGATPLFWWFHFLEDEDQYFHYKALAAFVKGLDRRGLELAPAQVDIAADGGLLRAQCMVGPRAALLWVYDRGLSREKREFAPMRGATLTLQGLTPGRYRVEFWNTYTGKIIKAEEMAVLAGPTQLALPDFSKDLACKVLPAAPAKNVAPSAVKP